MTSSCNCGGGKNSPVRYNAELVSKLRSNLSNSTYYSRLSEPNVQLSLLAIDSNLALEVLSIDESNKKSLILFQKVGSFNFLDLEITKFDLQYPKLEMVIHFKISPFDGGSTFSVEGDIIIKCPDISTMSGCSVDLRLGKAGEIATFINWDCLKNCAPQCLYCGGNWQCWLACAGGCIIQCL